MRNQSLWVKFGVFGVVLSIIMVMGFAVVYAAETTETETTTTDTEVDTVLPENFTKAVEVEEATKVEGVLVGAEADYFKMPLNAGYQMKVFGSATKEGSSSSNRLELNLYQEGGNKLSTDDAPSDGTETVEVFYYKGMTASDSENPEMVFIEVKNKQLSADDADPINYNISFERIDRSDASANIDAGDDFTTALDLQFKDGKGSFNKNFLGYNECGGASNKYCSTDEVDYYMLSMKSGERLTFTVTPGAEMSAHLALYDGDQQRAESERSTNPGAVTEIKYTADTAEDVYITVSSRDFGSYGMEIAVENAGAVTPVSPTPTAATSPATTPSSTPSISDSFNIWDYQLYLIIGGVVVVVIIIIAIVISVIRRRQGKNQSADVEKMRQQMRQKQQEGPKGSLPQLGAARTMHSDMKRAPQAPGPKQLPKKQAAGAPGSSPQAKTAPLPKAPSPPQKSAPAPPPSW